jgi:hypothetical protein
LCHKVVNKSTLIRHRIYANVYLDTKGGLRASQEFSGQTGSSIDQAFLDGIVDWISAVLEISADYEDQHVTLGVHIPADLSTQGPVISRKPEGPIEVLM